VSDLTATGDVALAGRIDLLERAPGPFPEHELTPGEAREQFQRLGWRSVVGYQTRNIPHRAHEYLQRLALEREEIDGLLVHPVVGRLKPGDYRSDVVVRAYEILLEQYFPPDRARLATLAITMRYAGPRAALFLALVRKNFGCSHYIVGRDQAGVGGLYDPYEAHRIFDRYETGIVPLRFAESFVCRPCGGVASPKTCRHPDSDRESVSQTRVRAAIRAREPLPPGLLRPEVEEYLLRLGPAALNLAAEGPTAGAGVATRAAAARVPGE
jgi:sulfate adenylyltransferase